MKLPVMPPIKPMLAKPVSIVPDGMLYEPKWDGFRTVVFRDGDEVELASRNQRPMNRYFPELVEAVRAQLPERCVVDGEIVVIVDHDHWAPESTSDAPTLPHLDFEVLQQRIHPAGSRVELLAAETPASFIAYDLLALGDEPLVGTVFAERRRRLAAALAGADGPVYCTPVTDSRRVAERWFRVFEGAGLDGIIAKPPDLTYQPDKRVMFKVKHDRTADCVVVGFRWHKSGPVVGSLLLGLYSEEGTLRHVGVSASFPMARRRELLDELAPYRLRPGESHPWDWDEHKPGDVVDGRRVPGSMQSRWNAGKDLSFERLRPELVVEVAYDAMEGPRFRHTAQFRRWRPDRTPESCTYDQLERAVSYDLAAILAAGRTATTDRDIRRPDV